MSVFLITGIGCDVVCPPQTCFVTLVGVWVVLTLSIKIAQQPYIIGCLGPEALKYQYFEGKGKGFTYHAKMKTFCGAL